MSMDLARKDFSTAPEYFIAGTDIGIAKATKTASAAVEAHAPVLIEGGKVKPVAAAAGAGQAVLTGLYSKRIYRCLPYTATSKRACS